MSEEASRIISKPKMVSQSEGMLHWECDEYYGTLRASAAGFPIKNGPFKVLGITATDETARHDWREFQQLKNHLVGKEWEAVELYPAESRLVDPSNRFYLWCVPKGVFLFGLPGNERRVLDADEAIAPQRPFPAGALSEGR